MKTRVALFTFSETRDEFYEKRKHLVAEEICKISQALAEQIDLLVYPEIRNKRQAMLQVEEAKTQGIDAAILHAPIWSAPNMAVSVARLLSVPLLVLGNERLETSSLVGTLAVAGGLDQCGITHRRLIGDVTDEAVRRAIMAFCQAAYAVAGLKGSTFGYFGGRSLGICTATADANQWQRIFGIDVEHIDQSEIIRESETIEGGEVERYQKWFETNAGHVEFDSSCVNAKTLQRQIRSYLALKRMIDSRQLDFAGVKCQTELSDHHCIQCLGVSLLNDKFDPDGSKEAVPCSCEADMDGALTMRILQLLSGGKVTNLMDIRFFNRKDGIFTFANCGSMPASFASIEGNGWDQVHLIPHVFGKAGGAATQFVAAPRKFTIARLCRKNGDYRMTVFSGHSVQVDREELRKTTWSFPHLFLKTDMDFDLFFQNFSSNHVHAVEGDHVMEVLEYCRLMDIPCDLYPKALYKSERVSL